MTLCLYNTHSYTHMHVCIHALTVKHTNIYTMCHTLTFSLTHLVGKLQTLDILLRQLKQGGHR